MMGEFKKKKCLLVWWFLFLIFYFILYAYIAYKIAMSFQSIQDVSRYLIGSKDLNSLKNLTEPLSMVCAINYDQLIAILLLMLVLAPLLDEKVELLQNRFISYWFKSFMIL